MKKSTQIATSKGIEMMYHSQLPVDYQVFSGLDISKVPDYLKPYFKEMSDGFF
ncbi:hypothetical protein [Enterococcus mundtii]|uniref:hypothetical protein n=1 Tax=Enterococcus mundtii TaxID=53346 RepID=UPI0035C6DB58